MPIQVTSSTASPVVAPVFPAATVESRLTAVLLESISFSASLADVQLPPDVPSQINALIPLDSLDVVGMLCEIEAIVGFELSEKLVRSGGYESAAAAMKHLMPKIESAWLKFQTPGGRK